MSDKLKRLECFRSALKAEANDKKQKEGRGYQSRIAKDAEVSKTYLSDIARGEKPGSEEVRHRIALTLGYEYEEFIELGKLVLEKMTLQEARTHIKNARVLKPEQDGIIEKLLAIWPELSTQEKQSTYNSARQSRYKSWIKKRKLTNLPEKVEDRLKVIWNEVFSSANNSPTYPENIFDIMEEYKEGLLSDIDIFEQAKDHMTKLSFT